MFCRLMSRCTWEYRWSIRDSTDMHCLLEYWLFISDGYAVSLSIRSDITWCSSDIMTSICLSMRDDHYLCLVEWLLQVFSIWLLPYIESMFHNPRTSKFHRLLNEYECWSCHSKQCREFHHTRKSVVMRHYMATPKCGCTRAEVRVVMEETKSTMDVVTLNRFATRASINAQELVHPNNREHFTDLFVWYALTVSYRRMCIRHRLQMIKWRASDRCCLWVVGSKWSLSASSRLTHGIEHARYHVHMLCNDWQSDQLDVDMHDILDVSDTSRTQWRDSSRTFVCIHLSHESTYV